MERRRAETVVFLLPAVVYWGLLVFVAAGLEDDLIA